MLSTERIIIRPSTVGGVGGKVNVYEPLFVIFSNNTKWTLIKFAEVITLRLCNLEK